MIDFSASGSDLALAKSIGAMRGPVFAVLDGGHFDDLGASLAGAGIQARSLFLGDGERDAQRYGPWFAAVPDAQAFATILGIVSGLPAIVFWSCSGGDTMLYGHLRRLNLVRLPGWAAAGKDAPELGVEADEVPETVIFRHWDPRVLGALLPVLDASQFARVLGPADEVDFVADDYGGLLRVVSDPAWPPPPSGSLAIRPEQVTALAERRAEVRRLRVAAYLRSVTGSDLQNVGDTEVLRHVVQSEASALALGLGSEASFCRWAYLLYATAGHAADLPSLRECLHQPGLSPDEQLERLVDEAIRTMRETRAHATQGTS